MSKLKPPVNKLDHINGNPLSPAILVEYGDFQCPHCGAAYPLIKQIEKHYQNQLAFVFRHFPLAEAHPYAQAAAVASEASANQGKFWEMHDLIYENQPEINLDILFRLAERLKLNMKIFQHDFKDPNLFVKVEADFESGILSGVNGTPSFYINSVKYNGSYDFQSLSQAINHQLLNQSDKKAV